MTDVGKSLWGTHCCNCHQCHTFCCRKRSLSDDNGRMNSTVVLCFSSSSPYMYVAYNQDWDGVEQKAEHWGSRKGFHEAKDDSLILTGVIQISTYMHQWLSSLYLSRALNCPRLKLYPRHSPGDMREGNLFPAALLPARHAQVSKVPINQSCLRGSWSAGFVFVWGAKGVLDLPWNESVSYCQIRFVLPQCLSVLIVSLRL